MFVFQPVKPESSRVKPPIVVDVRFHAFDRYIGRAAFRAGNERCRHQSPWANPYRTREHGGAGQCIVLFGELMRKRLAEGGLNGVGERSYNCPDPEWWDAARWRVELMRLEGLSLGCWCKGKRMAGACHGDVLVELWRELRRQDA